MSTQKDYGRFIIDFDPESPQQHLTEFELSIPSVRTEDLLPGAIPWPSNSAPTASPMKKTPSEDSDLSAFRGFDAVVVTWTSAEAAALARLFTPGYPPSSWYEYRHNVSNYIPLVTGVKAPFNDKAAKMERYFHSMGLYFPCTIGKAKVLLFKSGLHLAYDGPQTPVKKLMLEIYEAVKPKVFITTGTGGAIGKDVLLGDVVIATNTKFDCTSQFKNEKWAKSVFPTTPLPPKALAAITPALTKPNALRITGARPVPKMWSDDQSSIVTTDFFAFDDSKDTYKLQGLGRACDMGDAMVSNAVQSVKGLDFFAIRNASDPQIPNPTGDIEAAKKLSAEIYSKYGGLTTAASVVATWAIIDTIINDKKN